MYSESVITPYGFSLYAFRFRLGIGRTYVTYTF